MPRVYTKHTRTYVYALQVIKITDKFFIYQLQLNAKPIKAMSSFYRILWSNHAGKQCSRAKGQIKNQFPSGVEVTRLPHTPPAHCQEELQSHNAVYIHN